MADKNPKKMATTTEGNEAEIAKRIQEAGATEVVTNFDPEKSEYVTSVRTHVEACQGTGATPLEALNNAESAFAVYRASRGE